MATIKQNTIAIYRYSKYAVKMLIALPKPKVLFSIVYNFPIWLKYIDPKRNSVDDQQPWLTFSAIRFLKKMVNKNMMVYEWGSGGSTLFWSNHAAKVVSIEHDRNWFYKLQHVLQAKENVTYELIEPAFDNAYNSALVADYKICVSKDPDFYGYNFNDYVSDIDKYSGDSFDMIVVDGRARPACVFHAIKKIKPGGYLLLDNSEREHYQPAIQLLENQGWKRFDFYGPAPYAYDFSVTSFFRRF
jgi:hypothetical protein